MRTRGVRVFMLEWSIQSIFRKYSSNGIPGGEDTEVWTQKIPDYISFPSLFLLSIVFLILPRCPVSVSPAAVAAAVAIHQSIHSSMHHPNVFGSYFFVPVHNSARLVVCARMRAGTSSSSNKNKSRTFATLPRIAAQADKASTKARSSAAMW